VVLGNLDYGFEKANQFGIACTIAPCPCGDRYEGFPKDIIEYNTGVVFFNKTKSATFFEHWKRNAEIVNADLKVFMDSDNSHRVLKYQDQASFCYTFNEMAMHPFVLPLNWNYRPRTYVQYWGELKIWHDSLPVPNEVYKWNSDQNEPGSCKKMFAINMKRPTPSV